MWFLFQRIIAILMSLLLFDAFQDCRSVWDVWHTFRTMPHIAQIGTIAIVLIVLFVVWETASFLYRFAKPFLWRTVPHLVRSLNFWLKARKASSTKNKLEALPPPGLHTDLAPLLDTPMVPARPGEVRRDHEAE